MLLNIKETIANGGITKSFKSETMWFGYALTALGVVEANLGFFEKDLGSNYGYFATAIGVAVAVLRMATTKPLQDL